MFPEPWVITWPRLEKYWIKSEAPILDNLSAWLVVTLELLVLVNDLYLASMYLIVNSKFPFWVLILNGGGWGQPTPQTHVGIAVSAILMINVDWVYTEAGVKPQGYYSPFVGRPTRLDININSILLDDLNLLIKVVKEVWFINDKQK
jgi:hypothetical protein